MANYDVLIIGGGVIGLSLARELHRCGERRIVVVDRGRMGREASYAAAGMLAPNAENEVIDDFYRLCDASRQMFPAFADELLAETGVDIELDRTGTLYAAFTEEDAEHLSVKFSRQTAAGIPVQKLSAGETLRAEPSLSAEVRSSLFFPNDWQVENRKLLAALESYAAKNGISLADNTEVESLIVDGRIVRGVNTRRGALYAAATVLATGAWTSLIKIGAGTIPIEVKPVRGQIISYAPPEPVFRHVVYTPRGYLVPRADGRILIGATVEEAGFDASTTAEAEQALIDAAREFSPVLRGLPVAERWAGLRPFAGGGLPIIGEVPGWEDLFVGTGHYRNGILLTPITARILAHKILRSSDDPPYMQLAAAVGGRGEGNAIA